MENKESDERNGDLRADGILRAADEVGDAKRLLHRPEEKLDHPASLVEIGQVLNGGVEIVAEDAQDLAGLRLDLDLSNRSAHRVATVFGLTRRQKADAIGQDARRWIERDSRSMNTLSIQRPRPSIEILMPALRRFRR